LDQIKSYTIKYYEKKLLEDSEVCTPVYHPGGLELTHELAKEARVGKHSMVLDVASGAGETALYLATIFRCKVVGVDLSRQMVKHAIKKVKEMGLGQQVKFVIADAERLPFKDGVFMAAISECSVCLFSNKLMALSEMSRVVKLKGKVAITDVVLRGDLPERMKIPLFHATCISGAETLEGYAEIFKQAGLIEIRTKDFSSHILRLINQSLKDQKRAQEIPDLGENALSLLCNCDAELNDEVLQAIFLFLWLEKIGYGMISGVKP